MTHSPENLTHPQRDRLRRFAAEQSVDVHCHCLPGMDDGPDTLDQALALCRSLTDDGITLAIATPHQLGRFDGRNSTAEIRRAVSDLNANLAEAEVPLAVAPGADVRVDERILAMLCSDTLGTLADGGKYLLLELPHETFIDLRPLLVRLRTSGIRAIVSHPERHAFLTTHPAAVDPWVEEGALLQVTAGSLLGQFGSGAERLGWRWLAEGVVALVATDAHDTGERRPRMSEAIDKIASRLGHAAARRTCVDNPLRVLRGEDLPARTGRAERRKRA